MAVPGSESNPRKMKIGKPDSIMRVARKNGFRDNAAIWWSKWSFIDCCI